MTSTPIADKMKEKLQAAFSPEALELIDESSKHRGHAGHNPLGESHFRLVMRAAALNGQSRLQRQQRVLAVLAEELQGRVHALSLQVDGTDKP